MKRLLKILLGLILIILLTYFCFISTSINIENDLISKTEKIYKDNNIKKITIKMQGEGLNKKRVLLLSGTVPTYKEKLQIEILTQNIDGVHKVINQITIVPVSSIKYIPSVEVVPKTIPSVEVVPKIIPSVEVIPKIIPSVEVVPKTIPPVDKTIVDIPTVVTVPKVIVIIPKPIKVVEVPIPIKIEENKK